MGRRLNQIEATQIEGGGLWINQIEGGGLKQRMSHRIVTKQEAQARQVLNIPLAFICVTDNTLTNNIHHPNTTNTKHHEQVQATPPLILNPSAKDCCALFASTTQSNLTPGL